MCGIFGLISDKWIPEAEQAASLMSHRGPDDSGIYRDGSLCMIHYRLSILDTSKNGHQPMLTTDGRYVIVLNGEIYNHLELRKELPNHNFKSGTDTETILYYFARFGIQLFSKLNGIFALAIYDTIDKELLIARDHIGVKPLYIHHSDAGFVFSSELKSIAALSDIDKTLDIESLFKYIQFMYAPGNDTPFLNIKKFESGHYMKISVKDLKNVQFQKYYQIPFTGVYENKDEEYWIDAIDQALQTAVKRQLLSDVPVGYFISGGLDSSLIAAIARKLQPDKKLTGFTIRIKDLGNQDGFVDDYPFACKVADLLKIELQAISGNIDFNHDLNGMIWQLDEPQAEPSSIYVGEIARKSREQGIYVLLSGVGGDDLFAGYRRHQAVMFDKYLFRFPYFLRKMLSGMAELIPVHTASIRRFKKYLSKFKEREINDAIANYYKWLSDEKVLSIFSNNSQLDLKNYNTSQILKKSLINISGEHHPINKLLYWDMHYFLPDHNLNYTDKMSMKHGVEVRVPFCDIDLIKLSTIIPPELKIKNGTAKYLLKKVAERYLPHHLIYRPKTGFGGPVRKWVIHDFKSIIEDRLIKNSNSNYKIFNYEQIQKLIEDNRKGNVDASYSIVAILVIHLWLDLFLND